MKKLAMKKRLFAALLALALALGLAAPAGVVMTAEATVSASDAQYYLLVLEQLPWDNSHLVDFDGDGRDELLTSRAHETIPDGARYSIFSGGQALLTDQTTFAIAQFMEATIYSREGKWYINEQGDYYTVQNGQWVKAYYLDNVPDAWGDSDPRPFTDAELAAIEYFADGQKVSQEEYSRQINSMQFQFSIMKPGDARPQLEAILQAETLKNAAPDEILAQIPYYGDRSKCRMTSEMAAAYAEKLANLEFKEGQPRSSDDSFYYHDIQAYLCDLEGNGTPALMVDYHIVSDDPGWSWAGEYNADIYGWNNGQVVKIGEICWDRTYGTAASEVFTTFGKNRFGGYGWSVWSREMAGAWRYNNVYYFKNGELQHSLCKEIVDLDTYIITVYLDETVKGTFPEDTGYEESAGLVQELIEQVGGPIAQGEENVVPIPQSAMQSALRAYADAKRFPTYSYAQAESGDRYYSDVAAAVAGQGTIQAVYRLLEDVYYVLLENQGKYTGAVVRGLVENGRPVWKVTQTDAEPAEEDVLTQLVNWLASTANLNLDFGKLRGSPAVDDLADYLREVLANIDGLAPNDPAKSDLAAFVDGAVASLASDSVNGKDNRLTLAENMVADLAKQAREASDSLSGELRNAGVELNKSLTPKVRVLWGNIDREKACQLTFDQKLAQALDGCDLQVLLGDGQTYIQISAGDLRALTDELGQLSIQFQEEEKGVYAIRFLDGTGAVVERLSRPVTVGLPAAGELSTIMASYAGGNDNWGGQYDPASGTVTFETSFSGQYEVLENSVAIDDIEGLSEESRSAISFMVSRGYMSADGGLFRPGDPLTRYEFTEALVGMFFALDRSLTTNFPDVSADNPYYPYVASAQARDIVKGFDDGTFGGEYNITREQVFALAARTLTDQKGYTRPTDLDSYLSGFSDRDAISGWASAQVALSVREGVASRDSSIYPQANITREDAAVVLYQLFQLLYDVPPVALDVPEAAPEGLSTPVIIGICAVVAALAAGGSVALLLKKPKAASGEEHV